MAIAFRAAGTVKTGDAVTTLTLTAPTGLLTTDVVLACFQFSGGSGITITPPTGWNSVGRANDTTVSGLAVYRALGTTTWGAWTFTSCTVVGFPVAYSGVDTSGATFIDGSLGNQVNASSTTITAPSITTAVDNDMVVGFFGWFQASSQNVPTFSAEGGTHRQSGGLKGASKTVALDCIDFIQSPPGATGTKTVTVSSAQRNIGAMLAIKPILAGLRLLGLLGCGV